jgi:hypothetical protein
MHIQRWTCYIISMPSGGLVPKWSSNHNITSVLGWRKSTANRFCQSGVGNGLPLVSTWPLCGSMGSYTLMWVLQVQEELGELQGKNWHSNLLFTFPTYIPHLLFCISMYRIANAICYMGLELGYKYFVQLTRIDTLLWIYVHGVLRLHVRFKFLDPFSVRRSAFSEPPWFFLAKV